jgi:alpha/beta hydrolase family protein
VHVLEAGMPLGAGHASGTVPLIISPHILEVTLHVLLLSILRLCASNGVLWRNGPHFLMQLLRLEKRRDHPMHSPCTLGEVTSKDGPTIGYRQYGHGLGTILVQGAMGSAHNFAELAKTLSDAFTVYVPDHRGRGMSPRLYNQDYTIQREIEDLGTVRQKTGAHHVFGLSSGALISL